MTKIGIVTDTNSSVPAEEAQKLGIRMVPMPFYIDGECYLEGVDLPREQFFAKQLADADISTSTPGPIEIGRVWQEALTEYDEILHMPMSSGLSSTCAVAQSLAQEEMFAGRVFVVDNGRVAAPMHGCIREAVELIGEGYSAAEIKRMMEEQKNNFSIYIAVDNLKYLQKGGRISATTAKIGTILNMKPVLHFDTGTLGVFAKTRGKKRARLAMIEAIRSELTTTYSEAYAAGEVYLLAAGCAEAAETEDWLAEIGAAFPDLSVLYDDLPLSLSTHIGHGGLGIGIARKIVRK